MVLSRKKGLKKRVVRRASSSQKTTEKKRESSPIDEAALNNMIRERAYYLWQEKGRPMGQSDQIWVEAERQICSQKCSCK